MKTLIAIVACVGLAVAAVGCSKTDTATTTATTAPTAKAGGSGGSTPGAGSTAGGGTKGTLPKASNLPKVSKPAPGTTVDRTKSPVQENAFADFGLTPDEQDCVFGVLVLAATDDPSLATPTADSATILKLGGTIGGAMVLCSNKDRIAAALAQTAGSGLTATQKDCLTSFLQSQSEDDMAVFLGTLVAAGAIQNKAESDALLQPYRDAVNAACG